MCQHSEPVVGTRDYETKGDRNSDGIGSRQAQTRCAAAHRERGFIDFGRFGCPCSRFCRNSASAEIQTGSVTQRGADQAKSRSSVIHASFVGVYRAAFWIDTSVAGMEDRRELPAEGAFASLRPRVKVWESPDYRRSSIDLDPGCRGRTDAEKFPSIALNQPR